MREIYENAKKTMVYLGEIGDESRAVGFLRSIIKRFRTLVATADGAADTGDPQSVDWGFRWTTQQNQVSEWIVEHVTGSAEGARDWMAVREVIESPFWQRVWIFQEVVVSKSAVLGFGTWEMDMDIVTLCFMIIELAFRTLLVKARELFCHFDDDSLVPLIKSANYLHATFVTDQRLALTRGEMPLRDFKGLLEHSRTCKATDPRDRVYAFLNLVDRGYDIKPNYGASNTPANTFATAAARIMLFEQNLDILFYANESERIDGLPSWAPDWTSPGVFRPLEIGRVLLEPPSASGNYPAVVSFPEQTSEGPGRIMRTQALFID